MENIMKKRQEYVDAIRKLIKKIISTGEYSKYNAEIQYILKESGKLLWKWRAPYIEYSEYEDGFELEGEFFPFMLDYLPGYHEYC